MFNEAKKGQSPKYHPRAPDIKFSEASKKLTTPSTPSNSSNAAKLQNVSPKIQAEHSKGLNSRPNIVSSKQSGPASSKLQSASKPNDTKTSNGGSSKLSQTKTTESSSKKKLIKEPVFNNSKENASKISGLTDPLQRKTTMAKKQSFDPHKFLLGIKNKTSPVKFFPVLSKSQLTDLQNFTNEFFQIIKSTDYMSSGLLNYSNFCKVLHDLRFITNPFTKSEEETNCVLKAWRLLGGFDEQKVQIEDLHLFLVAIMAMPFKLDLVSAQSKSKKSIWTLKYKEIQNLAVEFGLLVDVRNNKFQIARNDSESQSITDQENDLMAEDSSNFLQDLSEQIDGAPGLSLIYDSGKGRLVRKISLRELSSTPTALLKSNTYGSANNDSSHNLSLNTSESDDAVHITSLLTPPAKASDNSAINKISVTKVSKEADKPDLNNTVSYQPSSKKFNFFNNEDLLGDSMMYESNLLNISELPFTSQNSQNNLQRRSQRVGNLNFQKQKGKELVDQNSFMQSSQASFKFSP